MKNNIKNILILSFLGLLISVQAQSDFTITKEAISDSVTKVTVDYVSNQRSAEFSIPLNENEFDMNPYFGDVNEAGTSTSGDNLVTTINLPDENGGVPPIAGIGFGNETVIYGGQRLLVLDNNNEVLLSKDISIAGNMEYYTSYQYYPRNIHLQKSENLVFCATQNGELLWLDGNDNFNTIHTESVAVGNQQSTILKHDVVNERLIWVVNDWNGTTWVKIFSDKAPFTLYAESDQFPQINDFDFDAQNQMIYFVESALTSYDYDLNLEYSKSLADYGQRGTFVVFNDAKLYVAPLVPKQITGGVYGDYFEMVEIFHANSTLHEYGNIPHFSTNPPSPVKIYSFKNDYLVINAGLKYYLYNIPNENIVFEMAAEIVNSTYTSDDSHYYLGGVHTILKGNETGTTNSTSTTTYSRSLVVNSIHLLSLSPLSGVISVFQKSNLEFINNIKTAVYAKRGEIADDINRAYFIESNLDTYTDGYLSIINTDNNTVYKSLAVGRRLVDIAYHDKTEKVAISSYTDNCVKIYDKAGFLLETIILEKDIGGRIIEDRPKMLISVDDKYVYVNAVFSVWAINMDNYNVELLYFDEDFAGENSYKGTDFVKNETTNEIFTILIGNSSNPYSQLLKIKEDQTYEVNTTIVNSWQESIDVDVENNSVYSGGIYTSDYKGPQITQYNGVTLTEKETIDLPCNSIIASSVAIAYSPYHRQLYVQTTPWQENSYFSIYTNNLNFVSQENTMTNPYGIIKDKKKDQNYFGNIFENSEGKLHQSFKNLDNLDDEWFEGELLLNNQMGHHYAFARLFDQARTPIKDLPNQTSKYFYTPNYGFSNISVIEVPKDTKKFLGKIKWLSFPRLERYSYGNEFVDVKSILLEQMYPEGSIFSLLNDENKKLKRENNQWVLSQFDEVQSTKGYKLEIEEWQTGKSPQWNFIDYQGGKLDPETNFDIHSGVDWVGYFLEFPQKPEEAFATILDDIVYIKAQYWGMYRETVGGPFTYVGKVSPLEYGDMVEVYCNSNHLDFKWNQGTKKDPVATLKTDYYSFEEKLDYEPIFVLLDENSDVQEIAVKVDGEVKGAAVREAGDTLVQVNAYLEGVDPNAQIELETYSGGKSPINLISDYLVYNKYNQRLEKRKVYSGEKAMYQVVSINPNDEGQLPSPLDQLDVYPVPANESLSISFLMNKASHLQLTIYNNLGQVIASPLNKSLNKGYYTYQWNLQNQEGKRVPTGIYFYRIDFPEIGVSENGKIIVQ